MIARAIETILQKKYTLGHDEARFCHHCGEPCGGAPTDPITPLDINTFARHASERLSDEGCLIVVLQPWGGTGGPPEGVLAPARGGEDAVLDESDLANALEGKRTILVPCTLMTKTEEKAAQSIIAQLEPHEEITLLMMLLIAPEDQLTLDDVETVMERHAFAVALRVDNVIMSSIDELPELRETVRLTTSLLDVDRHRIEERLAVEPPLMMPEQRIALEQHHQQLIWQDIPKHMMSRFPNANSDLIE